jgi:putative flippase GtrA
LSRSAQGPQPLIQRFAHAYQRFKHVILEGAKFGIVGLTGVAVTNVVFIALHGLLHLGPLTSVTVATASATVVTFLGNRHWSFRTREGAGTRREGVMFFMLNGVGLLIQYAVLGFSNYALGMTTKTENVIAVNVGIGFGTLFRWWSYRKWIWVPPEVNIARLRRGRHRRGRDLSTVPPPPAAVAGSTAPSAPGGDRATTRRPVPRHHP